MCIDRGGVLLCSGGDYGGEGEGGKRSRRRIGEKEERSKEQRRRI